MKKLAITVFAIILGGSMQLFAQNLTFKQGENLVGLTIGFGGNMYSDFGWSDVKRTPAISVSYERCVKENLFDDRSSLGIGGLLGYSSAKYTFNSWGYGWKWKSNNVIIGVRGVLHYAFVNKLDTYTGLMLGYNIASTKFTYSGNYSPYWGEPTSNSDGGFAWCWFLGARYYFTDSFAVMAELGYGITVLNLGASFKF